jgi:hypothetical protein
MAVPRLLCTICGVEVTLDDDTTGAMLAEVTTFCAAHNTHPDGVGVEVIMPTEEEETP